MKIDDYGDFKKYSGQDWYIGKHYVNLDLRAEIFSEVVQYEIINELQPTIIHKANGESYVRYYNGSVGGYEEYLELKRIEDLKNKKNRKKYFWEKE